MPSKQTWLALALLSTAWPTISFSYTSEYTEQQRIEDIAITGTQSGWIVNPIAGGASENAVLGPVFKITAEGTQHLAFLRGSTADSALVYRYSDNENWLEETIAGNLQAAKVVIDLDSDGNPHVVYSTKTLDQVTGGFDSSEFDLVYAYRNEAGWHSEVISNDLGAKNHSFVLSADGKPHIAFYTKYPLRKLHYATKVNGVWTIEVVDSTQATGFSSSIHLDSTGEPHIAYSYGSSSVSLGSDSLLYASRHNGTWSTQIASDEDLPVNISPILALDSQDLPHIAHGSNGSSNGDLSEGDVVYTVFDGSQWSSTIVATGIARAKTLDMVLDNDLTSIAYFDSASGPITEVRSLMISDNISGSWQAQKIWETTGDTHVDIELSMAGEPMVLFDMNPTFLAGSDTGYWAAIAEKGQTPTFMDEVHYVGMMETFGSAAYLQFTEQGQLKTQWPYHAPNFDSNLKANTYSQLDSNIKGMGLGDFDNDGLTDFVVAGMKSGESNIVHIELHNKVSALNNVFDTALHGSVTEVGTVSASKPTDIAVADFNGDGRDDFVLGVQGAYSVYLFISNGDGSFQPPVELTTQVVAAGLDAEDVNGDGYADFVASAYYYNQKLNVFLGNGDGTFTDTLIELDHIQAGSSTFTSIALSDFDGDSKVDAVLTNYPDASANTNGLAFYKGDGVGGFNTTPVYSAPEVGANSASQLDIRTIDNDDLNRDGVMDVTFVDAETKQAYVYAGNGDGTFTQLAQDYPVQISSSSCDPGATICLLDPEDFEFHPTIKHNKIIHALSTMPYNTVNSNLKGLNPDAITTGDQTVHAGSVTLLDGTPSHDPDGDYPLSYTWSLISSPEGSNAVLSDSNQAQATLVPDVLGDYRIQLVVTDAKGNSSLPTETLISTTNTAPVADAGEDQEILVIGSLVTLDGSQSWDDDGDTITYAWQLQLPPGSSATLSDATAIDPQFTTDVQGDYTAILVVSDGWSFSSSSSVVISFENVAPIADAGVNQSVMQGDTVSLDGFGSTDVNGDSLSFTWNLVSLPEGSTAEIASPNSVQSSLTTDLAGEYIISLIVNDGYVDSEPQNVTIVATSYQDALISALQALLEANNTLSKDAFKNKNMRGVLANKITSIINKVNRGYFEEAYGQLDNDIKGKANGCAEEGSVDKNDWVQDCGSQASLQIHINQSLLLLDQLL